MAMFALVDMAKSPEQVQEEMKPYDAPRELDQIPRYPYGLCISLDDDSLDKLGLSEQPEVGDGVELICMAKVTNYSETEKADGSKCRRVELQITHMGLGEDHEEGEG